MRFAAETEVSPERSRAEIERLLLRYGAARFAYQVGPLAAQVGFEMNGKLLRFDVPLPDKNDERFKRGAKLKYSGYRERSAEQAFRAWEQEVRQRWRAMALVIKAKLELVTSGIAEFETEFLPYIVLPGSGQTVSDWLRPQLDEVYAKGRLPPLLPAHREE